MKFGTPSYIIWLKSHVMDQSEYETNNTQNCMIESPIPESLKTEPCWLGIDEAGRGPVLGPMVYGTCFSPLSQKERLNGMGLADSKTLSEEQRESIFTLMSEATDKALGWMVEILSPTFISNNMLKREKYNLNWLSHDCAINLIKTVLKRGVNVTEIYVDTVGDPMKYQDKLKGIFPTIDITVSKKADSIYPIVSGASICAKVARDRAVKHWKFQEGLATENLKYGSGYPGDPETKNFLTTNLDKVFGFPQFVRFSWSTANVMIQKSCVPVQWEDDDENEAAKNTPSMMSFFSKSGGPVHKPHSFFSERCLTHVTQL